MKYIFDLGPFRILINNYYESTFPTLWGSFNEMIVEEEIISVREVFNEIKRKTDRLVTWAENNKNVFHQPTEIEIEYIKDIFEVNHFKQLIKKGKILKGSPVADPFVIAKARYHKGCVVTQETYKPNSARIPNICKYFEIDCINFEEFMNTEDWNF